MNRSQQSQIAQDLCFGSELYDLKGIESVLLLHKISLLEQEGTYFLEFS